MKGIAFKLWTGMLALVIVVLILMWLFQIVFLEKYYIDQRKENAINYGLTIADDFYTLEDHELEKRIELMKVNFQAKVDIIASDGKSIYSSDQRGPMMYGMFDRAAFSDMFSGKVITAGGKHPRFGYEFIIIGIPIKKNEEVTSGMIINMPIPAVRETAGILKRQLVYITFVLLAVAIALTYALSKVFTGPILEITKAAEQMASGNLKVKLIPRSNDEIGRLASTINYLSEKLSKVDQLRRDIIANVSHELRTPLSLIKGYAETIRDVSGESKERRERHLQIIIEESDRLGKIVDDILNLSQMQAGYTTLNQGSFSLKSTIESVISRYDVIISSTGVSLYADNIIECNVIADESRIEQVLYNLINNAFNHSSAGDVITIRTLDKGDSIRVDISDQGKGIPKDDLQYIWERYYKVHKTAAGKHVGTGLGLSIVKSILEYHKSKFGVESKLGEGTTFWFELKKA